MKTLSPLLFIGFLLCSSAIFGQIETVKTVFQKAEEILDSTERQDFLENEIWSFRTKDVKLAISLLDSVAMERGGFDALPAYSRLVYYAGVLYKNDSQFEKSEKNFLRFRSFFEPRNDSVRLSGVNSTLGSLMFDQARYAESMSYYKKSLSYISVSDRPKARLVPLARLGNIMDELGRHDDAKIYFNESIELARAIKDSFEIGNCLMNQGLSFEKQELPDSALLVYKEAENYFRGINSKIAMVYLNSNMAIVFNQKENYQAMKARAKEANLAAKEIGNQKMAIISDMQMGLANVKLGNLDQGISSLNRVLNSKSDALINKRKKDIPIILFSPDSELEIKEDDIVINDIYLGLETTYAFDSAFGTSLPCNINVACDEGIGWDCQISSVCKIIIGNSACSGSLVNNDCCDLTPYILTANHCVTGASPANMTFRFNYQSPQCDSNEEPNPSQWIVFSGSQLRSNWNGTDFGLLELFEEGVEGISYAGWNREANPPTNEVTCIHHPAGDVKKIAINTNGVGAQGNFWLIEQFEAGLVEPGSSGSPLFDENGLVIGDLSGGDLNLGCDGDHGLADNNDYGQLSVSWDGGGTANSRLRDWLGASTNPNTLD